MCNIGDPNQNNMTFWAYLTTSDSEAIVQTLMYFARVFPKYYACKIQEIKDEVK